MEKYTTVLHQSKFEYEEKKSVFIAEALPVSNEEDAISFLESIKKKYPDAKHHVYAYILRQNSTARFSDDREPQGTAGMPVLDVIRKNGCTDVIIVVTRYFGGTLLGTGGLVRAYTSSAIGALKEAQIITYDIYSTYSIECNYSDFQRLSSVFDEFGFRVENTRYTENVVIDGSIMREKEDAFVDKIIQLTSARCKFEKKFEKFDY